MHPGGLFFAYAGDDPTSFACVSVSKPDIEIENPNDDPITYDLLIFGAESA